MNPDYRATFPFESLMFATGETRNVECRIPIYMTVERIVLPRSTVGVFDIRGVVCGIREICRQWDTERFVGLDSESPFGAFNVHPGQPVTITVTNLLDRPQKFEGASVRGCELIGRFILDQELEALQDRGTALEANSETAVYGRGWNAAVAALSGQSSHWKGLFPRA